MNRDAVFRFSRCLKEDFRKFWFHLRGLLRSLRQKC